MSLPAAVQAQLELLQNGADKQINSFITLDTEGVVQAVKDMHSEESRRLLEGYTLGIKDNIEVAGLPCTGGTLAFKNYIPDRDATAVERLKRAGAIVMGKTNLHEMCCGITSINHAFKSVVNACNPEYIAGGSSGGTAVAIASGFVRAGLGTDTGGSVRIPSALNGIVGFRPTIGRYPNDGLMPISSTKDTIGPMGLTVTDVSLLDAVITDEEPVLQDVDVSLLKLGVPRSHYYQNLDPEVENVMEKVFTKLSAAGVTMVDEDLHDIGELDKKTNFQIGMYEWGQLLPHYLQNTIGITLAELCEKIVSPDVKKALCEVADGIISEATYKEALEVHRPHMQKIFSDYFAKHKVDAIIFPTTPLPARRIDKTGDTVELNGKQVPTFLTYITNTDPSSNVGIPSLTLPAGKTKLGLPVGIQLEGPVNSDRHLLATGCALANILKNN